MKLLEYYRENIWRRRGVRNGCPAVVAVKRVLRVRTRAQVTYCLLKGLKQMRGGVEIAEKWEQRRSWFFYSLESYEKSKRSGEK